MNTDAENFRPFDTMLDKSRALRTLQEATCGADDGEIFLERRQSEVLTLDDGRIKNASFNAREGFGLRAVLGATVGYAHSSEITGGALDRAAETARLAVSDGGGIMSLPSTPTNQRLYTDRNPVAESDFAEKVELLGEIDSFARELDQRVVQVTASISASYQEVEILRTDGTAVRDARPLVHMMTAVIVEENGRRESGNAGTGGRTTIDGLIEPASWQALIRESLRIALVNLRAGPAPVGIVDVVLGPGWPGILLHEAVGHGLEGDFNRKKCSAFSGLMGQRVASPGVTVLDDGTLPDRRGSITFDDEGTPSARNVLIEDGILVAYMQDRQNARLMEVAPTGNGRRQSFAHAPMPRMTNTYMLSGTDEPEDIVGDLRDGIYAIGFAGGQVDITNGKFVFSCNEAYRVTNGKVGEPVKNATLIGDGATALKQIRAIGNDMSLDPGIGTCGKDGQWVPVGVGLPSILIGGLTVGGNEA